jgi:hypothetical protein
MCIDIRTRDGKVPDHRCDYEDMVYEVPEQHPTEWVVLKPLGMRACGELLSAGQGRFCQRHRTYVWD